MLTSLFETLTGGIAGLIDTLLIWFTGSLSLELGNYLELFPLLGNVYSIFQAISLGMTLVIAGLALVRFSSNAIGSNQQNDTPVSVLFKTVAAGIAIYAGGYVLELLVELGKMPYELFEGLNVKLGTEAEGSVATKVIGCIGGELAGLLVAPDLVLVDLAIALFEFFLVALLAFNMFKLILEVCERYMMVGILVFTSPLAYCTIPSKETSDIFKKWVSMFVGSLIMMTMSIAFLKIILNGLANVNQGENYILRLLLVLATCKIAQQVDTYLQQLGIGVATTGQSMVDDAMFFASTIGRLGHHGGGGGGTGGGGTPKTVLGAGLKAGAESYAKQEGNPLKAAGNAMVNRLPIAKGIKNGVEAKKNGASTGKAVATDAKARGASTGKAVAAGIKGTVGSVAANVGAHTGFTDKMGIPAMRQQAEKERTIKAEKEEAKAEKEKEKAEQLAYQAKRDQQSQMDREERIAQQQQREQQVQVEKESKARSIAEKDAYSSQISYSNARNRQIDIRQSQAAALSENATIKEPKTYNEANQNFQKYGISNVKTGPYSKDEKFGDVVPCREAKAAGVEITYDNMGTAHTDGINSEARVAFVQYAISHHGDSDIANDHEYHEVNNQLIQNATTDFTAGECTNIANGLSLKYGIVEPSIQKDFDGIVSKATNMNVQDSHITQISSCEDQYGNKYPGGNVIEGWTSIRNDQGDKVQQQVKFMDENAFKAFKIQNPEVALSAEPYIMANSETKYLLRIQDSNNSSVKSKVHIGNFEKL